MTTAEQMPDLPPLSLLDDEGTRGFSVADMLNYARAYAAQEVARETDRVCRLILQYPEWIGRTAKEDICFAIRARNA